MQQTLDNIINEYRNIGVGLKRQPSSFSFGNIDECKALFLQAFQSVDKTIANVQWLPEYDSILQWMSDTKGKGLLLSGGVGVGKSVIVCGVLPVLFRYKFNKLVFPYSAYDISQKQEEIKKHAIICIDDVGCEPIANRFGEKREVFSELVDHAETCLKPLFITTNLNGQSFSQRYGQRTIDRIIRLCEMIKIEGKSFRK